MQFSLTTKKVEGEKGQNLQKDCCCVNFTSAICHLNCPNQFGFRFVQPKEIRKTLKAQIRLFAQPLIRISLQTDRNSLTYPR